MRRFLVAAVAVLGVMLPNMAHAALITGELDFSGGAVVDATTVKWFQFLNPSINPNIATINSSTVKDGGVTVANLLPPNTLFETNLDFTTFIPGTTLNIDLFEHSTNTSAPVIDYKLTHIDTCAELGAGFTCLGASPFGFVPNANGTAVILGMTGLVFDTATPGITNQWTGVWTTQVNMSLADIFTIIEAGGTIQNSYSGTKITASGVPEPATLLTFGFGSLALARYRRRKKAA